jgi:hypothetical protein
VFRTAAIVLPLVLALAACGGSTDPVLHKRPPSLASSAATWMNVDAPLDWKGLIGNVVYLQFGFLR